MCLARYFVGALLDVVGDQLAGQVEFPAFVGGRLDAAQLAFNDMAHHAYDGDAPGELGCVVRVVVFAPAGDALRVAVPAPDDALGAAHVIGNAVEVLDLGAWLPCQQFVWWPSRGSTRFCSRRRPWSACRARG